MFHLLSLELKKFRKNAVVDLFAIMFLVTMPTVIFIAKQGQDIPQAVLSSEKIFTFPNIWDFQGYVGNWLVFFFLGFIMLYIITSEVGFKTMRQNIITGLSRKEYYLSKFYVGLAFSIFTTLYYVVIVLAIGYFHADPHSFEGAFDNKMAILRFFLMCMGYMSFAIFLGFLFRRSGLAIFFYVCYVIFIEKLIKLVVKSQIEEPDFINYLPLNSIDDLMPNPAYKIKEYSSTIKFDLNLLLTDNQAMISSTIYILIFLGLSYWNFQKQDI